MMLNNSSAVQLLAGQLSTLPRRCDDDELIGIHLIGRESIIPEVLVDVDKRRFRAGVVLRFLQYIKRHNHLYADIYIDTQYIDKYGDKNDNLAPTLIDSFVRSKLHFRNNERSIANHVWVFDVILSWSMLLSL